MSSAAGTTRSAAGQLAAAIGQLAVSSSELTSSPVPCVRASWFGAKLKASLRPYLVDAIERGMKRAAETEVETLSAP